MRERRWGALSWVQDTFSMRTIVKLFCVLTSLVLIPIVEAAATFSDENWISNGSVSGSGMNGRINAFAATGNDLYAGGDFTTADGVSVNHIAKWNGSEWSALESGMNDEVRALAVSGTNLYVGGWFTMAGGIPANRIAKW